MERTKGIPEVKADDSVGIIEIKPPAMPKWRKVGGGSLSFPNKIIKPGQIFSRYIEDIPVGFRKFLVPVDEAAVAALSSAPKGSLSVEPRIIVPVLYTMKRRGSRYEVLDEKGKVINEKLLTKDEAESMIKSLQT